MPRTVDVQRRAVGRLDVERAADAELVLGGPLLVDDRAVVAQRGHDGVVALGPVEAEDLRQGGRLDAVDELHVAERQAAVLGDAADGAHAGNGGGLAGDLVVDRRPAVAADDHLVGGHAALQRRGRGVLDPGRHDGDERDQRDADRERDRGRQRAARLAHRVAAGQEAGRAADGLRRTAEQRDHAADGATDELGLLGGRLAQHRDRRDARRAPRRDEAGQRRHDRADGHGRDGRAGGEDRADLGQVEPERAERGGQQLRDAEAGRDADDRGEDAEEQRLDDDGAAAPGGATRRPAAAGRAHASAGRP